MSGAVYYLYFIGEESRKYYGTTNDFKSRLSTHVAALRLGWHPNWLLREACRKHGLENLRVRVLKYEKDLQLERTLIKNDLYCLNIRGHESESTIHKIQRISRRKQQDLIVTRPTFNAHLN